MTNALTRMGLRRMVGRDGHERHRAASPLELLFDLVFVVAVSQASVNLHHLVSEGEVGWGVVTYLMVFFAVWWAWMNFTWFASAFDTDDWLYRVMTIVQMGGVLVLAAGVHDAMVDGDFLIVTWGYVIMRLAMVGQWARVAASDPAIRRTAIRYAIGIVVVQALWVARISALDATWQFWTFFVLAAVESLVPVWAERFTPTAWHPHHIAERYGLFTLILLGESILASANAVIDALQEGEHTGELIGLAVAGLVVVAAMWWAYFAFDHDRRLASAIERSSYTTAFVYGYGQYVVFAAAGAVSAGVEVVLDEIAGHTEIAPVVAYLAFSLPVAAFLASVWLLLLRGRLSAGTSAGYLVATALIALAGVVVSATLVIVVVLTVAVVVLLELDAGRRRARRSDDATA